MATTNKIKEEIYFKGGLDQDADDKGIIQGDYIDALNVINVEHAKEGIIVNIKGNISVYSDSTVTWFRMCGWAYYNKKNTLVLFLHYDNRGYIGSKIVEFNPFTQISTIIFDDTNNSLLEFQDPSENDYFIKADITDDILAFADANHMVRMINIQDVKDGDVSIDEAYLDLCRRPPIQQPTWLFGSDDTISYNQLNGEYQFKYRYVYSDYRPSVYSQCSDLAISNIRTRCQDVKYTGTDDNILYVKFNSGDANVRWIDIAVRESNTGIFGRIVKIDKDSPEKVYTVATIPVLMTTYLDDNTSYYFRFINDESKISIGDDGIKQYDTIPDVSETLSFIGDNRLCIAGNSDGKELIDLDVTLTEQHDNPSIFESLAIHTVSIADPNSLEIYFDLDDMIGAGARITWYPGDFVYFNFKIDFSISGVSPPEGSVTFNEYVYVTKRITSIDELGQYLADYTYSPTYDGSLSSPLLFVTYEATPNFLKFDIPIPPLTFSSATIGLDSSIILNRAYDYYVTRGFVTDQSFKSAKSHSLALIYKDKYGKKWPAQTSSDTYIRIGSRAIEGDGFCSIYYDISHSAPLDAVSYRWAYAYKFNSFIQTLITDVSGFDEADGTQSELLALDVSGYNNMLYAQYTFEEGDIIKILRPGKADNSFELGEWSDEEPVFIIERVSDIISVGSTDYSGKWLMVKPLSSGGYSGAFGVAALVGYSKFLNAFIEVSKPPTSVNETVYYEIGTGGTCNAGSHTPSSGYLNSGDVWVYPIIRYKRFGIQRDDVSPAMYMIESPYPYETSENHDVGIGDINIEYPESRHKYENTIYYSNKYFQDTQVNGLSTFDYDDKVDVSDTYGKIKGLEELGNSLTIICEEQTLSSYVGATEYTDSQGNTNVVTSDKVLGYIKAHNEKYGTFLKESICNTGEYIYFFDLLNCAIVRKSVNGLFAISGKINNSGYFYDYKMFSFFKDLSNKLQNDLYSYEDSMSEPYFYKIKCYTGYDPEYGNIYFTFVDKKIPDKPDTTTNITLIFNENKNRWLTKYTSYNLTDNIYATMYAYTPAHIYHFNEGDSKIYLLNSDDVDRCMLYGYAQDYYIQFTTHANHNIIKIYNSIAIHTNDEFTIDSIESEANMSYPNGMYSTILDSDFIFETGVQKAAFKKNMKTRSSAATYYDLENGEELRNYNLRIKMSGTSGEDVELYKVDVLSELTK